MQLDLRKKFDQLPSLGGKKFSYKNKRSGERERDVIPISMEEFVKTLYAFLYGPDDVFGGTGHVFDATKGGGYAKLFGDEWARFSQWSRRKRSSCTQAFGLYVTRPNSFGVLELEKVLNLALNDDGCSTMRLANPFGYPIRSRMLIQPLRSAFWPIRLGSDKITTGL